MRRSISAIPTATASSSTAIGRKTNGRAARTAPSGCTRGHSISRRSFLKAVAAAAGAARS
ncbi:MAG: hypothetical protein DMD48_03775 [Gemmatimonadetes bacterium]|nr:MAG: hypothetical protein DMD48_03775 [Gemmatimonadota bacterium]